MLTAAPKLLSVREVADFLGCHPKTIYDLVKNGELEALQPRGKGHSLFIEQQTLEHWLAGGRSTAEREPQRPRASDSHRSPTQSAFSPRSAA